MDVSARDFKRDEVVTKGVRVHERELISFVCLWGSSRVILLMQEECSSCELQISHRVQSMQPRRLGVLVRAKLILIFTLLSTSSSVICHPHLFQSSAHSCLFSRILPSSSQQVSSLPHRLPLQASQGLLHNKDLPPKYQL